MKIRRILLLILCCILIIACGLPAMGEKKEENPAQSSSTELPTLIEQPTQIVQPTKAVDMSYLKKFKCPENANKIVFSSDWNPLATTNFDILIANDDGSEETRLTDRTVWEGNPVWSPDRCRIAYVAETDPNNAFDKNTLQDIYVMDPKGGNRVRLTNSEDNDREPDWSPDGKQIVFMSERDKNREIYVMSVKGTNQKRLTKSKADDEHPQWSPKNDGIVFSSHRDGNWEIYLMNIDGSNLLNLTNSTAEDKDCVWSPDGNRIAFFSNRTGTNEIFIMNKDGSDLQQITHQKGNLPTVDKDISWSPDGLWIGFTGSAEGKSREKLQEIYKAAVDGSGVQLLISRDPSISNEVDW
jgi:Tol biopolymer transport system component